MNTDFTNYFFIYLTVIILSLLQSRFKLIRNQPVVHVLFLIFTPLILIGTTQLETLWIDSIIIEICFFTLLISLFNAKRLLLRINEGYILTYTLFHWYLLIDSINIKGLSFISVLVLIISIYPTFLILKASFEHKLLEKRNKFILCYWFLFTIVYTFVDQVALSIFDPLWAFKYVSMKSFLYDIYVAVQLYFIATAFSLILLAIPIFHLDNSIENVIIQWRTAIKEWKSMLNHQLGNYIEYQISPIQVFLIVFMSISLFFLDVYIGIRSYLIFVYYTIFPLLFFYFQYSPRKNIDE